MTVYRLYVKGEIVGTYGTRALATMAMGEWFTNGYKGEDCEVKAEEY